MTSADLANRRSPFNLAAVAHRIVLAADGRHEAWVLARYDDDAATDLWFLVARARTRRSARRALRRHWSWATKARP